MPNNTSIKDELVNQIVNRLRKFGFVNVSKKNILTDEVYSQFFFKILNEKLGENSERDIAINQLLSIINNERQTANKIV